jgi:CRP-like cAMP-binding protein
MLRRATPGRQPRGGLPRRCDFWHHAGMAGREELVDTIASFALFADLPNPRLEGIVHLFEEAVFGEGEKILRQGLTGSGFYVILDGEAAIVVDGTERARLGRGEFFGEVSIILGESPIADVVAIRPLRCLVLPGPRVESFLVDHPRVMYRMLQAQARRLRAANRWRS